jgi:hypothetical protein
VADLRGLKMRIPGMGGEVMNRLGVTVQVLGGGEIYPALERGAIDATEWVGPYDDEKLGFHRGALLLLPGWWEPGPSMSFMVNRQAWDRLPKAYQEAFEVAAVYAANGTQTIYDAKNPAALERLVAGGTSSAPFSRRDHARPRAPRATCWSSTPPPTPVPQGLRRVAQVPRGLVPLVRHGGAGVRRLRFGGLDVTSAQESGDQAREHDDASSPMSWMTMNGMTPRYRSPSGSRGGARRAGRTARSRRAVSGTTSAGSSRS